MYPDDQFDVKHFNLLENMNFMHLKKKPRLDLPSNRDRNFGDDLWGQDNITAEEFDMLEFQATQTLVEDNVPRNVCLPSRDTSNETNVLLNEEMKQQTYEMEGKVKLLTDTLEKLSKELKEEKLNKNKGIHEKTLEFQEKENTWQKEIQKLESILQFKEQEMKSVYNKMHLLESNLQNKKDNPESSSTRSPNTDRKMFKSDNTLPTTSSTVNSISTLPCRKYRLMVDTPQGKPFGVNIVSSLLCNRLVSPLAPAEPSSDQCINYARLSTVSVGRLNSDQTIEGLLDYYIGVLRDYLVQLRSFTSEIATISSNTKSPLSPRRKYPDQLVGISCLKDLAYITSCPQFASLISRWEMEDKSLSDNMVTEQSDNESSSLLLMVCDQKMNSSSSNVQSLWKLLICLANPDTYPNGYLKHEEIEWSLSSLVSWSSSKPHSIVGFAHEIPVSLINCSHNVTSSYLSLHLLSNLCVYKEFIPALIHKDDDCLLYTVGDMLLHKISIAPLKFINVMLMVVDFLSTIFTVHSVSEFHLESSYCLTKILQGVVMSLLIFYEHCKKDNYEVIPILKKGFGLVHLLSRSLPNFKGKRTAFENHYISLVCKVLSLSKENPAFKDFHDVIHDLWDFQEDTSELDLDDPSDDSLQLSEV